MADVSSLAWFDAHLDLAYMAENGRDMTLPPETCGGPDQPCAVSFASLAAGRVTHCLATVFTQAMEAGEEMGQSQMYRAGDFEGAHAAGRRQMARYADWHRPHFYRQLARAGGDEANGAVRPSAGGGGAGPREGAANGSRVTHTPASQVPIAPDFLILIEGADPILDPGDLGEWRQEGVVAIGMAWWKPSRYAGGNGTDLGLSDAGRALAQAMDELGVVHDASHLSDRAFWELCDATDKVIMASHSNCRALLGGGKRGENQRHLDDDQIREIVGRGGIIGLNLVRNFIRTGLDRNNPLDRPSIGEAIAHVEHICDVAGHRRCVGLGSDMDGGIRSTDMPAGIDRPADLGRLAEALWARGWSDEEVRGFAFDNWAKFWGVKVD